MSATLHALEYLSRKRRPKAASVCVLFGDEAYSKRLVFEALRSQVLEDETAEFCEETYEGKSAEWRDVMDAVATPSLFGSAGKRLVVIRDADEFVSQHRRQLEEYAERPSPTGVLVLEVSRWPKNTRIAKSVAESGLTIDCSEAQGAKLRRWLVARAKDLHECELGNDVADFLIEAIGPEPGLLDQELLKLATAVGPGEEVTMSLAERLAVGGRARTAWEMLDQAMAGRVDVSLSHLDRLLVDGENPIAILAQISSNLRRLAASLALLEHAKASGRRLSVRDAMSQAGVRHFVLEKSERQLRQLGRSRASQLYRWLLEADLDLKGQSQLPGRAVLERLLVRLGKRLPAA